jgi:hypothetical protein
VDIGVVVSAELLLLLGCERAQGLGEVSVGVLAANHEADLSGGVSWDGRVGVLDVGENLLAVLLELGDQWKVEPLVLGCGEELAGAEGQTGDRTKRSGQDDRRFRKCRGEGKGH